MPIFKGCNGKSSPRAVIEYVTRDGKAAFVDVINLAEGFDYAKQFDSTFIRFGKGTGPRGRRYYHFKLSPARSDGVSPETMREFAVRVAAELFPDFQCVVATHADTETVHAHIVVNAVNCRTGRKLRVLNGAYAEMIDRVNELGLEYGLSPSGFGEGTAGTRRTTAETQIMKKGEKSWKEDLREKIRTAAHKALSTAEFVEILGKEGVRAEKADPCTDFLYFYPGIERPCPGMKLGADFTYFSVAAEVFINDWEEHMKEEYMKEEYMKGEDDADT